MISSFGQHYLKFTRENSSEIKRLQSLGEEELVSTARDIGASYELVKLVAETGKLPVPNFAAGGVATPADAALMRQLGAEAVFVGSGIFKSEDPAQRARAIVQATTHYDNPSKLLEVSKDLKAAMNGIEIGALTENQRLANRGW